VSSRVSFGTLVIILELNLPDEDTVTMIQENPHCHYFLGYPSRSYRCGKKPYTCRRIACKNDL